MEVESRTEIISSKNHFQRLRVSLIREEFLELTGHPYKAILLNQLYYWTQKVKDFDEMLKEEQERQINNDIELRHGWIYKSAKDFVHETLLNVSKHTFYRHMNYLLEQGWVETKSHPTHAWDKTTFYRLNLDKIYEDLQEIGFELPAVFQDSYRRVPPKAAEMFMSHYATSNSHYATYNKTTDKNTDIEKDILFKDTYIKESERASARNINDLKSQEEKIEFDMKIFIDAWNDCLTTKEKLSEGEEESLKDSIEKLFQGDIEKWKNFCGHITQNDFLMGREEAENKKRDKEWKISMKWISQLKNMTKIMEGFDRAKKKEQKESLPLKKEDKLMKEALKQIETIKDPYWKEVCNEVLLKWGYKESQPFGTSFCLRMQPNIEDLNAFLNSKLCQAELINLDDRIASLRILVEGKGFFERRLYGKPYTDLLKDIIKRSHPHIKSITTTMLDPHTNKECTW